MTQSFFIRNGKSMHAWGRKLFPTVLVLLGSTLFCSCFTISPSSPTYVMHSRLTAYRPPAIISSLSSTYMEVMDKSSLVPSHNATLALEKIRTLSENLSLTDDEIMAIPYTRRFHYRVAQLLHYNTTYGTMDVPYNYKDSKLAKWVQAQRYEHNIYRLELEERKLNIVGASSKLGDPSTPSTFSDASISKKAAIHGIKSHLTRERYELLEHMSFPWISSRAKKSGINQLDGTNQLDDVDEPKLIT